MLAVQARGCHIETVEGLGSPGAMHPLQEAFAESGALQCGFCTPGFLMTGIALLRKNPAPTPREVREAISGNLCRCTGYSGIIDAISRTGSP
jgi:carbon-monoxide dehydrogenase small subunit